MPKKRNPFEKPALVSALQHVYSVEQGYTHHPKDPGGETKFGIAKRYHPDVDVKNLTQEQANKIYEEKYWKPISGEKLPRKTSIAVMDTAIHSGPPKAIKHVQSIVGSKRTGQMTDETIEKVHGYVAKKGEQSLLGQLKGRRQTAFSRARARKTFGKGWQRRLTTLDKVTGE